MQPLSTRARRLQSDRHPQPQHLAGFIEWLSGHEISVYLGLLVVLMGASTFVYVADQVVAGRTLDIDEAILRAARSPQDASMPIGPSWLPRIGRDITALGGYAILTLVTTSVVVFLRLDRRRGAMWFVLLVIVGGFVIMLGLKSLYGRPRPDVVPHLSHSLHSSFPSGHAMMSVVVYLTLGSLLTRRVSRRELRVFFLAVPVALSLLIGCSRVYMGVHFPTDVLAGWAAGIAWVALCGLAAGWLQRKGMLEHGGNRRLTAGNRHLK